MMYANQEIPPSVNMTTMLLEAIHPAAIRTAIMMAGQGATILLAGKGHETYQITGSEKRHFDEREIISDIFKEMQL